ncbi:MAG: P-loop NTPase fold protein [Sideroxydans sp.]|nr:P-loop NTPase fold protein [Sideroxydans sp.]
MVVGIFSPWGSGKSSLLAMLEEKLQYKPDTEVGNFENTLRKQQGRWVVVKFSPWIYRNEKSLLLPLLATLAKQSPVFTKLMKQIVNSGPSLIKKLTGTLIDASTTGLPLLTFLDSVRTEKENAKDLQEKIADAVRSVTGKDKRLVFLIDDLDRCHDPKQIVNLLEQIKLFLHLPRCLFIIAADRKHIVDAINIEFPNSGEEYLEKFVQLSFNLPQHNAHHLVEVLDMEESLRKPYLAVCQVLNFNPRKLKRLWNEAIVAMEVIKEVIYEKNMRASSQIHYAPIDMMLLVKWLLARTCVKLHTNPFLYLDFEKAGKNTETQKLFIQFFDFKNGDGTWKSESQRKLALYLWNDLETNRFGTARNLAQYAHACGDSNVEARHQIENECFENGDQAKFYGREFQYAGFSQVHFCNAIFNNCDFTGSDFTYADLLNTRFINCRFDEANFDNATINGTVWENCVGLENLDTEPEIYELIADAAAAQWRVTDSAARNQWHQDARYGLFKAYRTILNLHEKNSTLTEAIKKRIIDKGQAIRAEVEI